MLITLTTDFGAGGRYVSQMKGVLYSKAPGVTVVDLSHEIEPQDVAAAARLLQSAAPYWPDGVVHLAVVDPGVGTDRAIVAIEAIGQRFVGPDNGLFGWLGDRIERRVELDPARLDRVGDSNTFHGRDLMAPAAAALARGAGLDELGDEHDDLVALAVNTEVRVDADARRVEGRVIEVDRYGNLITNVPADALSGWPRDERLRTELGPHETFGLWRTYGEHPAGTLVSLVGSDGMLELAIVNGSAAEMLGAGAGAAVLFSWGEAESSE